MKIINPYEIKENPVNKAEVEVLKNWAKRHNEEIIELEIYAAAVIARTASKRTIRMIQADGYTYKNILKYLMMYEDVNGKRVRIKKSEW